MATRIGKLRHNVELQSSTSTVDTYGQKTKTWHPYAIVWAEIVPLAGRELEHAKQVSAETNHRIRIRYRSDVAAVDRVKWDNRIFEITAVLDADHRKTELTLMASEVAS